MSLATDAAPTRLNIRAFGLSNHAVLAGASALFLVPSAVFALSLRPLPAVAVIAGCLAALALVVADGRRCDRALLAAPIEMPRLVLAVGFAAALLLLGGETHLFFSTPDWQIRDAVLADLSRFGFPVTYAVDGATYVLRAPLGMYVAPAAIGHAFGLAAAQTALLIQNALLLGSIFYLLMSIGRGWPHLILLVLFGGLSIVGALLRDVLQPGVVLDYWRWSLDSWHPYFQFSSSMVQFFWVPNHALPGWWLATLFLLQRRSNLDVATIGVSVAALSFWSPLAVLPAVPWLAWQLCMAGRSIVASVRTWLGLAVAACFAPILFYMVAASASIAHGNGMKRPDFGFWYGLFVLIQLPALSFLAVCWRRVPRELLGLLLVNGIVLLGLPFFRFGPNNDLVMRGSTASLAVVAFVFSLVLLDLTRLKTMAASVGWIIAAGAVPSAALEIWRSVSVPRYRVSDCTLMQASRALDRAKLPTNYIAEAGAVSPSLIEVRGAVTAPVEPKTCWPDLPPTR